MQTKTLPEIVQEKMLALAYKGYSSPCLVDLARATESNTNDPPPCNTKVSRKLVGGPHYSIVHDNSGLAYALYKGGPLGCLGKGYQARVKLAQRLSDGLWVAVKILPIEQLDPTPNTSRSESLQQLKAENQILNTLELGYGLAEIKSNRHGLKGYLFLKLFDGKELWWLINNHKLSIKDKLAIAIQALQLLSHMHGLNIIHGDIKTENILYCQTNKILGIADYGFSKQLQVNQTRVQSASYTLKSVSPEQRKAGFISKRSDIYSLAILFRELNFFDESLTNTAQHPVLFMLIGLMSKENHNKRIDAKDALGFMRKIQAAWDQPNALRGIISELQSFEAPKEPSIRPRTYRYK